MASLKQRVCIYGVLIRSDQAYTYSTENAFEILWTESHNHYRRGHVEHLFLPRGVISFSTELCLRSPH